MIGVHIMLEKDLSILIDDDVLQEVPTQLGQELDQTPLLEVEEPMQWSNAAINKGFESLPLDQAMDPLIDDFGIKDTIETSQKVQSNVFIMETEFLSTEERIIQITDFSKKVSTENGQISIGAICYHIFKAKGNTSLAHIGQKIKQDKHKIIRAISRFRETNGRILSFEMLKSIVTKNTPISLLSSYATSYDQPVKPDMASKFGEFSLYNIWRLLNLNPINFVINYLGTAESTLETAIQKLFAEQSVKSKITLSQFKMMSEAEIASHPLCYDNLGIAMAASLLYSENNNNNTNNAMSITETVHNQKQFAEIDNGVMDEQSENESAMFSAHYIHDLVLKKVSIEDLLSVHKITADTYDSIFQQFYDTKKKKIATLRSLKTISVEEARLRLQARSGSNISYDSPINPNKKIYLSEYSFFDFWDALQKSGGKIYPACNYLCISKSSLQYAFKQAKQEEQILIHRIYMMKEAEVKCMPGYDQKLGGKNTSEAVVKLVRIIDSGENNEASISDPNSNQNNITDNSSVEVQEDNKPNFWSACQIHALVLQGVNVKKLASDYNLSKEAYEKIVSQFYYYDEKTKKEKIISISWFKNVSIADARACLKTRKGSNTTYDMPVNNEKSIPLSEYSFYDFWDALQKADGKMNIACHYLSVARASLQTAINKDKKKSKNVMDKIYNMTKEEVESLKGYNKKLGGKSAVKAGIKLIEIANSVPVASKEKITGEQNIVNDLNLSFKFKIIIEYFENIKFDLQANMAYQMDKKTKLVVPKENGDANYISLAMILYNISQRPEDNLSQHCATLMVTEKEFNSRLYKFCCSDGTVLDFEGCKKLINNNVTTTLWSQKIKLLAQVINFENKISELDSSLLQIWALLQKNSKTLICLFFGNDRTTLKNAVCKACNGTTLSSKVSSLEDLASLSEIQIKEHPLHNVPLADIIKPLSSFAEANHIDVNNNIAPTKEQPSPSSAAVEPFMLDGFRKRNQEKDAYSEAKKRMKKDQNQGPINSDDESGYDSDLSF